MNLTKDEQMRELSKLILAEINSADADTVFKDWSILPGLAGVCWPCKGVGGWLPRYDILVKHLGTGKIVLVSVYSHSKVNEVIQSILSVIVTRRLPDVQST